MEQLLEEELKNRSRNQETWVEMLNLVTVHHTKRKRKE